MVVRFLGTGAADWPQTAECRKMPGHRCLTSTLLDEHILIDVTESVMERIENPTEITDVFFTHSHNDHFSLSALQKLAPCRVYAHSSWADQIQGEGLEVVPLDILQHIVLPSGEEIVPLPSNHSTENKQETTLHYLIHSQSTRLLYATDGAWLRNEEYHAFRCDGLTAVVMDATVGVGHEEDFRVFEHNTLQMVDIMIKAMVHNGWLTKDAPVFLTHMARTLHGSQKEIEEHLTPPYIACYDGMIATI